MVDRVENILSDEEIEGDPELESEVEEFLGTDELDPDDDEFDPDQEDEVGEELVEE